MSDQSLNLSSSVPFPASMRYYSGALKRFIGANLVAALTTTSTSSTSPPSSNSFESQLNTTKYNDFVFGLRDNYGVISDSDEDSSSREEYVFPEVDGYLASSSSSIVDFTSRSPNFHVTTEQYFRSGENYYDSTGELTDFWNQLNEKNLRHSFAWTVVLIIAYMLILLIGIIGNCMVILVVLLRPQMRNVTNIFIMNLAVADLFVITCCVAPTLLANVLRPWILGSFMCKAVAYVQGVSVCASAYSLAAISLDRCKAIYRPMERPRGLSKTQALITICLIWLLALVMTLPWAVVFDVIKSEKDGLPYCVETWRNEEHGKVYFLVANLVFCYSLPLVLISISNVVIWCHVSRRKVPQDSASIGNIKRMHKRTRHGVRKMLGIVTLAFLISWLPLYVLVTRMKFSSQESIGEAEANLLSILIPFAQWLGSWNSSINPVLYAFLNSKFRESFRSLLPKWMPCARIKPALASGLATNGTIVGGTATPSYTTVYTARGSARSWKSTANSSMGSRSRHQSRRGLQPQHQQYHRSLIINQVKSSGTRNAGAATITDL